MAEGGEKGAEYILVSLPTNGPDQGSARATWAELAAKTERENELSTNYHFVVPDLRVGTLDSLLTLSDELSKSCLLAESTVGKIKRQLEDLGYDGELTVDGKPVHTFLTKFQWDEARYPQRRPLQEIVNKLNENVGSLEDDLKVRTNEFSQLKTHAQQIKRRATGSLAVRDVSDLVSDNDVVQDSEYMTTLLVAVPKSSSRQWWNKYEYLCEQVVPRSSKQISEDNEYILVTVVLFRRKMDEFKTAAREAGFSPREYTPSNERGKTQQEEQREIEEQLEGKRAEFEEWCKTSYGEAFSAQVHLYAVRLFVESVLRYGLPQAYLCALLMPHKRCEKKLRQVLASKFGQSGGFYKEGEQEESGVDEHPYVSLQPVIHA